MYRVGDFYILLSVINRTNSQNNKDIRRSEQHICYNLTFVEQYPQQFRTKAFFSSTHEMFIKTDHIPDHKISLSRYQKTEIVCSLLSDHNRIK